jgi:hypothetical protein
MNTVFQKYAAALLPFFILVVGASQTVLKAPIDWNATITFGIVVAGAVATFIVKLVPIKWQGALKTGVAILTAILSALLPFVLPGGFDPSVNWPIIIVAVLNALATELGVQVRTDPVVATGAGTVADPAVVTSVSEGAPSILPPDYEAKHREGV